MQIILSPSKKIAIETTLFLKNAETAVSTNKVFSNHSA